MKIAHLINSLDAFGGAETHLLALANAQRRAGHTATIFVLHGSTSLRGADAQSPRCLEIPPRYWARPWRIARFASILRRERFDVLNCHLPRSSAVGRLASFASRRTSVVLTEQNVRESRGRLGRTVHALLQNQVHAVIAVSEPVAVDAARLAPKLRNRMHVVPNCLDDVWFSVATDAEATRRALGIADEARVAICISRFASHKGHDILIRSFAEAAVAVSQAVLLLVGEGAMRASSDRLVHELGLSDRIRFLGRRADTLQLLDAADVAVLASRWEGLPLTLLEAQARGRAVVCTACAGSTSAVLSGESALVTPVGDAAALAGSLARVLSDPELAARLGERGRAWARSQFTSDRIAAATTTIYASASARRIRTPPGGGAMWSHQ